MSARRVLAGSVAALLLPASLLMNTSAGSAAGSDRAPAAASSVFTKAGQKISLEVLPGIVQPGKRPVSVSSAKGSAKGGGDADPLAGRSHAAEKYGQPLPETDPDEGDTRGRDASDAEPDADPLAGRSHAAEKYGDAGRER